MRAVTISLGAYQVALQHAATRCNTLLHIATPYTPIWMARVPWISFLGHIIWHCDTSQHTAVCYNTLQHAAARCNTFFSPTPWPCHLGHVRWHCNTLQHTTARCNTLQHAVTHCSILQHAATRCNTHCDTLQHTATRYNTLQHTSFGEYQAAIKRAFL